MVAGLIARLVDLSVLDQSFLRRQGDMRALRVVSTPSFRGMITDRKGAPLAISTPVYSAWFSPKTFEATPLNINSLATLLQTSPARIKDVYLKNQKRGFVYLKRDINPDAAARIKSAKIPGVFLQEDYKRYYPEGEVAAHLIGFTNVDDQGQEGLELAYNPWLAGLEGKELVVKDRIGRVISEEKTLQEQRTGKNLVLSIDKRIQYIAYRELLKGVQENQAVSGSIVVLDAKTGEILAMANQPSFNPNNRTSQSSDVYRNRALTDSFEPGSTMKAFSIASALDSGLFTPNTVIDTSPGRMNVGRNLVRDERNYGVLTVSEVLQKSSNVGTAKMVLALPPTQLWSLLHRVGFGQATAIGFPGEQTGSLVKRETWKPFALATLAYGYGVSVTAVQLAQAYSIFANEGVKYPVSLLKLDHVPQGDRVMSSKVANEMLSLLETVTTAKGATGSRAQVPGYRVAGKTGTALMAGPHGYQQHHYVSSFVGIAPVSHPRLVVAVIIKDSHGKKYFGGEVSAPVFEKTMEGALRVLDIPPDHA